LHLLYVSYLFLRGFLSNLYEEFGPEHSARTVAWIGDGNNMANSWLNAASQLGFELRLACPEGYDPDPNIMDRARDLTTITLTRDSAEAADGADVISTDVWASMGQEDETLEREAAFEKFVVDDRLMERADPSAIFLHCLPAHRGEEVTASVIDGPQSRIFDEAENRLHAQQALLEALIG